MNGLVTLSAVEYPGADMTVMLNDDAPRVLDGTAKYNVVPRPRRRDATEFDSEDPVKITFGIIFNKWSEQLSVENEIGRLYGWAAKNNLEEPPIVHVRGPVPYTQLDWKINKITDDGEVLYLPDDQRCRQELKLELIEWIPQDIVVQSKSPVAAAQAATAAASTPSADPAPSNGGATYVVGRGETLSGIALKKLGKASRYPELARINGISNPNKIRAGQVLKLP